MLQYGAGERLLQFSIGSLNGVSSDWVSYDASTVPGSGGSPVIAAKTWTLVGMHMRGGRDFNGGVSLASVLDSLRQSEAWGEIAQHHRLVDARPTQGPRAGVSAKSVARPARADSALLAAALRWNFDPESLGGEEREMLRPLVSDASAPLWALDTRERQRLIRGAGSLDELRRAWDVHAAKSNAGGTEDMFGRGVIKSILKGPPYDLEQIDDAELPYWLQAVRWFAGVVQGLPTPAEVNRTLERRRVRGRLQIVAGPGFKGRAAELARMQDWYEKPEAGPLVISGIGGIGKSSLVAHFASGLKGDAVLLWLDFDRADLASDDAESVLGLLCEQMAVQLDDFNAPEFGPDEWGRAADALGDALAARAPSGARPLLVLDGFEVAQHAKEHHRIWEVLEHIILKSPELHIVVSGRAAVQSLELCGRDAEPLPLEGMAESDAEAWLRERGINDDHVLKRVVEISRGVPLVLKLALRWVEDGGEVAELPRELPKALVEGFLYQRILDRVIDPLLKGVARDALVLRRLTREMLTAVLHDTLPEGFDEAEVFARLTREMGLVGADDTQGSTVMLGGLPGVLRLRPEVRSATLRLLEMDGAERVREIDRRAAEWYAGQDLKEAANAAELVYHRLRLGDLHGAAAAWSAECAGLLLYAEEELPESAREERAWLRERVSATAAQPVSLEVWEAEAVLRIRSAIGRGLPRTVKEVLGERAGRSAASPLVLYDAWTRWLANDLTGARSLLKEVGEGEGAVVRDRAVLGALLAVRDGDPRAAETLLAGIDDEAWWDDRPDGALEALAVRAARVRLVVDLPAEIELSDALLNRADDLRLSAELNDMLTAADLTLPHLSRGFEDQWISEVTGLSPGIPTDPTDLKRFARRLHRERLASLSKRALQSLPYVSDTEVVPPDAPWDGRELDPDLLASYSEEYWREIELGFRLFVLGWRRWHLATSSLFLARACEEALRGPGINNALRLSVAGTLAAFRGKQLEFSHSDYFPSLDHLLAVVVRAYQMVVVPVATAERAALATQAMRVEARGTGFGWAPPPFNLTQGPAGGSGESAEQNPLGDAGILVRNFLPDYTLDKTEHIGFHSVILYLLGPDPLEVLCRRIIGLPENPTT